MTDMNARIRAAAGRAPAPGEPGPTDPPPAAPASPDVAPDTKVNDYIRAASGRNRLATEPKETTL